MPKVKPRLTYPIIAFLACLLSFKMNLDITKPFGELIDAERFRAQFCDMQQHVTDRSAYHKWSSQLRFMTPIGKLNFQTPIENPDNDEDIVTYDELEEDGLDNDYTDGSSGLCECSELSWPIWGLDERTVRLAEPGECPECTQYVAVSYCWRGQELPNTNNQPFKVSRTQGERDSKARPSVLSRAIRYANIHKLRYIWIDQECIEQDNRQDKEAGIQSMDLVYQRSAYPVGIIDCYFSKQSQIDILELIMEGENFTTDQMEDLIEVLQLLKEDSWFTRAWVLQECVAAGWHMTILVQHDPNLEKPLLFGGLEGELMIDFFTLHSALGWVIGALDHLSHELEQHPDLNRRLREVISALDDVYPPTLEGPDYYNDKDPESRQVCNAAEALYYLQNRRNSRIPDRLAILSNLCNYSSRIDTTLMDERGYNFSTCAFILSILNGDMSLILSREPGETSTIAFSWGPPSNLMSSSMEYFHECLTPFRFGPSPSKLHDHGLVIEGYLWRRGYAIGMQDIQERFLERWTTQPKDEWLKAEIMWAVIQKLVRHKCSNIAELLWRSTGILSKRTPKNSSVDLFEVLDQNTAEIIFNGPKVPKVFKSFLPKRGVYWLVHDLMSTGHINPYQLARGGASATALFQGDAPQVSYILTPSSNLDVEDISTVEYLRRPVSWKVGASESDRTILRATDRRKGFWYTGADSTAETFILQ